MPDGLGAGVARASRSSRQLHLGFGSEGLGAEEGLGGKGWCQPSFFRRTPGEGRNLPRLSSRQPSEVPPHWGRCPSGLCPKLSRSSSNTPGYG
ncbi:hypothetical protein LIER_09393 [Lithospermum erythrorhizon]